MSAYRIDRRDYEVGSIILPGKEYQTKIKEAGQKLESILKERKPQNKPSRRESLFLFESYEEAKRFWTIMRNGNFYEVGFENTDILHIGDMSFTEEMFHCNEDDNALGKIADKYWSGEKSEKPRIEILVSKAIVTKTISKSEIDRRKALKERMT